MSPAACRRVSSSWAAVTSAWAWVDRVGGRVGSVLRRRQVLLGGLHGGLVVRHRLLRRRDIRPQPVQLVLRGGELGLLGRDLRVQRGLLIGEGLEGGVGVVELRLQPGDLVLGRLPLCRERGEVLRGLVDGLADRCLPWL